MSDHAPSGWQVQQAMEIVRSTLGRMMENEDGVSTDEQALLEMLAVGPYGVDVRTMIRRLVRAINEDESYAEAVAERIDELKGRHTRFLRRREEKRAALFAIMDTLGWTRLPDAEFTITISPGRRRAVVTDAERVPDQYCAISRKPVLLVIKTAMEDGETVPGAEWTNGLPVLTIHTK